jgi:glycosyltransferase involved in cell wall biosynthesis
MARPLVSTIIPAYNYGRFVCEAVESVLCQTYEPVEIVIVDDGSTDDTRERLNKFGDRIRYVYQENRGLSAARNTGIREARGEWLAFLDADDLWHPRKLEVQLGAVADAGDIPFVGSPWFREGSMPADLDPNPPVRRLELRDFFTGTPVSGSSAVIRSECFSRVGCFDESLRSVEDRDMWLRLAARYPAATIVSNCWWYRPHAGQMNLNPVRMHDNFVRVVNKFFIEHPEHHDLRSLATAFLHLDTSMCYLTAGNRVQAGRHLLRSMLSHPLPLGPGAQHLVRAKVLARVAVGERGLQWLAALKGGQDRQHDA